LAAKSAQSIAKLGDLLAAKTLLPTLLDNPEQRPPYFLSLPACGSRMNHPVAVGRLWPLVGRIRFDKDVAPPLHAVQIRRGAGEALKLTDGNSLLPDESHAVFPHGQ